MNKIITNYKYLNGIIFYIIWYACVYGACLNFELLGVLTGVILILVHFIISKKRKSDLIILGVYLVIGVIGDWLLISTRVIAYPFVTYDIMTIGVPLWILMLYASFAITVNHSMVMIHRYPKTCSFLGGIGGAISYYLSARIGAIILPLGWVSFLGIALYWFFILMFSKRLHDFLVPIPK
ncbi:MAG: DUF2878 domain-containing protein [Simkaniaceae bacterium]|nr:DUF2878 domain-containing protein [Simkaniaceae bacterium]